MELLDCSNEYDKLVLRMNMPRVVIDNGVCPNSTVVKIDSTRNQGILLESVQLLTDMNLWIRKAYISSDGKWNMDVFHVSDSNGNKLTDEKVVSYIEKSIESAHYCRTEKYTGLTALELTGTDRVGLLSEIFAVLAELQCDVVEAKAWTHKGRIAALMYVTDGSSEGTSIRDYSDRLRQIEGQLHSLLKGDDGATRTCVSITSHLAHMERRLHQMMFVDEYDNGLCSENAQYERDFGSEKSLIVSVHNLKKREYTVVNVECKDRMKLLFDVVCTLTDMAFVVFHAAVRTAGDMAFFEFYIRHTDGTPVNSEPERQHLIQCLQAAVERRASKGVRMELSTSDKPGLLAEVTRIFRESGLNIERTEISTKDGVASNIFYVTEGNGNHADPEIIELVRGKIGLNQLTVKEPWLAICGQMSEKELPETKENCGDGGGRGTMLVSLGNLVLRNLYYLGLIKSYF